MEVALNNNHIFLDLEHAIPFLLKYFKIQNRLFLGISLKYSITLTEFIIYINMHE